MTKPLTPGKISRLLSASRGLILEERREFQRAPVLIPIECRHENQKITGTSVDLSARGVLVEARKALREGAKVGVAFSLPDQPKRLKTKGEVVRVVKDQQMGIKFTQISAEDRKLIANFVEKALESMRPPKTPTVGREVRRHANR